MRLSDFPSGFAWIPGCGYCPAGAGTGAAEPGGACLDETEPDYPFDQLKQRYDGTLLAQYIETLETYSGAASGRKALYYGVQAMLNAMGEGQET